MPDKPTQQRLGEAEERIRELEAQIRTMEDQCALHDAERDVARTRLSLYERIISSTPDCISLVDRDYRYRLANDAFLDSIGKTREEVEGRHVSVICGRDHFKTTLRERLDRALAGETVNAQAWADLPGLGRRFLATSYNPVIVDAMDVEFVAVDSRDMTELKAKEEALHATARRLDLATGAGNIGIWERDLTTNRNYWDNKMYELHRVKPGEFDTVYEGWRARIHPDDFPEVERKMVEVIETRKRYEMEYRLLWPDGEIRNIRAAGAIQEEDGVAVRLIGVNWDVTDHRRMETELRRLASTDALTGASNRRSFMDRLVDELERSKRYGTGLVVLSLDIDHFKDINDTYGHPAGDEVLKELVRVCTGTLRTTDAFGRVGGEEFLAALTQTGLSAGLHTAERLRRNIERHVVRVDGHEITFTISIGVTERGSADETIDPLLRRADEALYKAKNNGRNRIETL